MKVLVTGSSGLVGSEVVRFFDCRGDSVVGIDNNLRADFFGTAGDTRPNLAALQAETRDYVHHDLDVRDRARVAELFRSVRPEAVVHCAAQPSHDLARKRPVEDFEVNALGTSSLLEAARAHAPEAPFVFFSTNKVYGDAPNELPLVELERRWEYAREEDREGIDESCRIDHSQHSLFGASKAAADLLVQEYGRQYGMPTCCLRASCLTGPRHAAVELHGFLAHLVKVAVSGGVYRIFGYLGKQVRDQLHAADVAEAVGEFVAAPRVAEVYNMGGGRENAASLLECVDRVESALGRRLATEYQDEPRRGDHICYISNVSRFRSHYPDWHQTRSLDDIIDEMVRRA